MALVRASGIALSPVVLLLITTSGLLSQPLLIPLCCLISKALPCAGTRSQLELCMHGHGVGGELLFDTERGKEKEEGARGTKSRVTGRCRGCRSNGGSGAGVGLEQIPAEIDVPHQRGPFWELRRDQEKGWGWCDSRV